MPLKMGRVSYKRGVRPYALLFFLSAQAVCQYSVLRVTANLYNSLRWVICALVAFLIMTMSAIGKGSVCSYRRMGGEYTILVRIGWLGFWNGA